jgi:hypothetical protein
LSRFGISVTFRLLDPESDHADVTRRVAELGRLGQNLSEEQEALGKELGFNFHFRMIIWYRFQLHHLWISWMFLASPLHTM